MGFASIQAAMMIYFIVAGLLLIGTSCAVVFLLGLAKDLCDSICRFLDAHAHKTNMGADYEARDHRDRNPFKSPNKV
jgi:hypothetical protein